MLSIEFAATLIRIARSSPLGRHVLILPTHTRFHGTAIRADRSYQRAKNSVGAVLMCELPKLIQCNTNLSKLSPSRDNLWE